ncbi:MAG: glycosyltransferase family 4 protein [Gammaproteobacteria bacterium]|nr:glycosyltransferase family 4 protein [Gammaproteobacteria bacterium]
MRVLFVNRFFHPDHSATSQMLTDLANDLSLAGVDVSVITSRQLIDNPHAALEHRERAGGVDVHRVWSTRFGRRSLVARGLDYLSFYLSAGWRLGRVCRRGDVVVAKTDPPLISVVAAWAARRRGAVLVNWLHDLFPEIAERLGVAMMRGWLYRTLRRVRDRSLQRARCNVVIGSRMAEQVGALGVPADRVRIIHNWSDGDAIRPLPRSQNVLRAAWKLEDRFVVAYSGNMGYAHEFDTVIDAAARLRARADIVFLFVGGGVRRAHLEQEAARRMLENVAFEPYQPRARLGESLAVGDVHLVSLRPCLEGLMVPSKFYAVAAAGRPVLFVGDAHGELARLIETGGCGASVSPGDGEALARHIVALAGDSARCEAQGAAARRLFEARFERRLAVADWRRALEAAAGTRA